MLGLMKVAALLILQAQIPDSLPPDSSRHMFEITPQIGVYLPAGRPFRVNGALHKERQLAAIVVGVGATTWLSRNFGIEGALGFSPSRVAVHTPGSVVDMPAPIWTGSLRFIVSTAPRNNAWSFYGMIGPGFVARKRPRDLAPATVFGAGATLTLPAMSFRFEFADALNRTGSLERNDLFLTLGLTLYLADNK